MSLQEFHRAPSAKVSAFGLFVSFIRERNGSVDDEARHIAGFIELLNEPQNEDFRDAILKEWLSMKYTGAFSAANPPTTAELKRRHQINKQSASESRKEIDAAAAKIAGRALLMIMPNNKRLADCTGAECVSFGGWFTRIGKRVGPKRKVGDVLNESDLAKLRKR